MSVVRRFVSTCSVLVLIVLALTSTLCAQARVVAVGDVHGDLGSLRAMLRDAGVIDANDRWIGGKTILVQTGDVVDRGPQSRGALELLMSLEKQAPKAGGKVIPLLGNHEVMNIIGDLRYTSAAEWASYADAKSPQRRQVALDQYKGWLKQRGKPELAPEAQKEWLSQHPLGFVEHREAFSARGRYGKWLRQHSAMVHVGDTLFVHGGISPKLAANSPQQINRTIGDELRAFDAAKAMLVDAGAALPFFNFKEITEAAVEMASAEGNRAPEPARDEMGHERRAALRPFLKYPEWLCMNREGPLWFPGYAQWTDQEGAAQIGDILASQHASRIVVGHMTQEGRIRPRWDGKVYLIDTGMLQTYYPGGQRSALEIDGAKLTAIYADTKVVLAPAQTTLGREPLAPTRGGGEDPQQTPAAPQFTEVQHVWVDSEGKPLPFKNDAEILAFLKTAKVIKDSGIPQGITGPRKLLLEKNGVRANAVFRSIDEEKPLQNFATGAEMFFRDSYIFEPAAYQMSLLLGLDNVPPATLRTYQGTEGSIQIWLEKAMTEAIRIDKGIKPPDGDYWNKQINRMNIFDELVYNTDRNRGNLLITPDWEVWFIDHTRAFRRIEKLLNESRINQCERDMFEKMKALDEPTLQQRLGPYLRKPEIKALLKRRDMIVTRLNRLIAEKGEDKVLFTLVPPQAAHPAAEEKKP